MEKTTDVSKQLKKRPDIWFFYAFLFSLPLSVRKILYFIPVNGRFNEFTSASIYLSDIFLFISILLWIIIFCNVFNVLSMFRSFATLKISAKKLFTQLIHNQIVTFCFILSTISFLSTWWSEDKILALYRSVKTLEFSLIVIYIQKNIFFMLPKELFHVEHSVDNSDNSEIDHSTPASLKKGSALTFSFNKAFITVFQIYTRICGIMKKAFKSLLKKIKLIPAYVSRGTSVLFNNCSQLFHVEQLQNEMFHVKQFYFGKIVKKCSTWNNLEIPAGEKNVPRGTIWRFLRERKMFHVEQLQDSCGGEKCSTWNNCVDKCFTWNIFGNFLGAGNRNFEISRRKKLFKHYGLSKAFIIFIQIVAIILTFSKSAIIALFIAFVYLGSVRGIYNTKIGSVKHSPSDNVIFAYKKTLLVTLILAVLAFHALNINYTYFIGQSVADRIEFINVSRGTIVDNPLWGIGAGQYVMHLLHKPTTQDWQFEPVHNTFLLVWAELGVFALSVFIWLLVKLFHVEQSGIFRSNSAPYLKAILVAFVLIMFTDHYIWDIQQGFFLFAVLVGILSSRNIRYLTY